MERVVIKNGYLVDPASQKEGEYDLILEGGVVREVAPAGKLPGTAEAVIVDAKGKWIFPGLVDLHVHLREPGFEWKETVESGSKAAVRGGYTTICAMPNTRPVNDTAQVTEFILEKASECGLAKVLPIGAVSLGSLGKQMAPLSELRHAGCIAFSDDGEPIHDAGLMRRALEWCLMFGATISCHEEDKSLSCCGCMNESALSAKLGLAGWPKVAEEVMIARDIELARTTGGRVHICHVSTGRGIELIRRAKADGIPITCEVTPHHLLLTEEAVRGYDTDAKMSPPLRAQEDCDALLAGVKDGTVDAIASDHAPHEKDSKVVEFQEATFGILGLQSSLPLMLEFVERKEITLKRAVEILSFGPAKAFGIKAGSLALGMPADITIIDPKHEWKFESSEISSLSKNSPFLGRKMKGAASDVIIGGRVLVENGKLKE